MYQLMVGYPVTRPGFVFDRFSLHQSISLALFQRKQCRIDIGYWLNVMTVKIF
jgi:hypothetical protein